MPDYIIDANHLSKRYQDANNILTILDDVHFRVKTGETVAIVGASGSGKSTLLHILGTLDEPDSGSLLCADKDVFSMSKSEQAVFRNTSLGFVYQFHHLLPEFNALENVAMPLLIAGIKKPDALGKAELLLDRVGLKDRAAHKPQQLSGGERQRVAIARSLVNDPLIVLADEPTGNLDSKTSDMIYELIAQINKETNTAFVLVTHDNHLAAKMNTSYLLKGGKLAQMENLM